MIGDFMLVFVLFTLFVLLVGIAFGIIVTTREKIIIKRKAKKTLKAFLENLKQPVFDAEYIKHHQIRIEAVKWLLAYYEGRTAATPEVLLESFIGDAVNQTASADLKNHRLIWIDVLYHWIKRKEIVGF